MIQPVKSEQCVGDIIAGGERNFSTRVTVTRLLSQLEQQGHIERQSLQRIVLRDDEIWHYQI